MTRLLVVTVLLATVAVVLALRNRNGVATRSLKVTARAGLSRNAAIVVVEVEGRRLLIGAAANSVNLIAELGPNESADGDVADQPDLAAVGRPAVRPAVRPAARPVPAGASVMNRLRSMTTRSFATAVVADADGRMNDQRGLV